MLAYQKIKLSPKPEKIKNPWCRSIYRVAGQLAGNSCFGVGVDPGVNFGVTFIQQGHLVVYYGALIQQYEPGEYGLVAMRFLKSLFKEHGVRGTCTVEGAAFHKQFGQVGLAEVRQGFYMAARLASSNCVSITPPATIRKTVFNDGRTQAGDEWPLLNHNGADSLSIALYSLQVKP
jgi:hypothetical protein